MLNHFSLLKVHPGTSQNGVEEAFAQFKLSISGYAPGIEMSEAEIARHFPDVWQAYQGLLDPASRQEYEKKLRSPAETPKETSVNEPNKVDESLWSWLSSGFVQAGFILVVLSCIYALVHFAAL